MPLGGLGLSARGPAALRARARAWQRLVPRTAHGELRSPHRLASLRPECVDGGEVPRGLVGESLGIDVEELLHRGPSVLKGAQELLKSSPTLKLRRKTSRLPAVSPTVTTST